MEYKVACKRQINKGKKKKIKRRNDESTTHSLFHLLRNNTRYMYEGCPESSRTLQIKTRIGYHRLMKFCINKYQLSGTLHTQYDGMFLKIDRFIGH